MCVFFRVFIAFSLNYIGLSEPNESENNLNFHPDEIKEFQKAREDLFTAINNNPSIESYELAPLMSEFMAKFRLKFNYHDDSDIFFKHLQKFDPDIKKSHSDIIYIFYSNYLLHLDRKDAWNKLIENIADDKTVDEYSTYMEYFARLFFVEGSEITQDELIKIIINREPSIAKDSIPIDLYIKYSKYMNNNIMREARDNVLSEIEDSSKIEIHQYDRSMLAFIDAFKIKRFDYAKDELNKYLINLYPQFDYPSGQFNKFWRTYETYQKYLNCKEKRKAVIELYSKDEVLSYSKIRNPMKSFRDACELNILYRDYESFIADIKKVDNKISASEANFLFYDYKSFAIFVTREYTTDMLIKYINKQKENPKLNIESQLKDFILAFDLSMEKMEMEHLMPLLEEIKWNPEEQINYNDILLKYNEYIDLLNIKKVIDDLNTKIYENPHIKSYELKSVMDDFIKAVKLEKYQEFYDDQGFLEHVRKFLPDFTPEEQTEIEPRYIEYLDYQKREEQRQRILRIIKEDKKLLIPSIEDEFDNFKSLHFETSDLYNEYERFKTKLQEMDGVSEEDCELLYPFYSNYLSYKEKEIARRKLLKYHYENELAYIYNMKDLVKEFIKKNYLEFDEILNIDAFKKYLKSQDLEIVDYENNILHRRYLEYLSYTKMVESRVKIMKMIKDNMKLSEMKEIIAAFIAQSSLKKDLVFNKFEFKNHILIYDPDFGENDIEEFNDKIIAYYELIERLPIKERLLEFITLYPNPKITDLEIYITPFFVHYHLKYQGFINSDQFHKHLQKFEDDIRDDESSKIFQYYKIFSKMNHRWNIRNKLIELLEKESAESFSKLFPLLQLFVTEYKLTYYNFASVHDFQTIVDSRDETFDENFIAPIYNLVVKYFTFVDRIQRRNALFDFKKQRTNATINEFDIYVNQVFETYNIDYDILSDFDKFKEHVIELDYTITEIQVLNLYTIIFNHVQIIERIKAKEAVFDMINSCIEYKNNHIFNLMIIFVNSYKLDGMKITNINSFYDTLLQQDETISMDDAKKIYPYYNKYLYYADGQIIRNTLLEYINEHPGYTPEKISEYIKPYIKSHGLQVHELYKFERFFLKNKAMDEDISYYEIEKLWGFTQRFIIGKQFIKEQNLILLHDDVIYDTKFIKPTGIKGMFYSFFRYFGVYPHYLPNEINYDELSSNQKSFEKSYRSLTGIEYFWVRPGKLIKIPLATVI